MSEGFFVDTPWLTGYGDLLEAEAGNLGGIHSHFELYAKPNGGYWGLMALLEKPVELYVNSAQDRIGNHGRVCRESATELRDASTRYRVIEEARVREWQEAEPPDVGEEKGEDYPASSPSLKEPEGDFEDEISKMFAEFRGVVGCVDWLLDEVLGWQIHYEVIEHLIGDWTKLRNAGMVLRSGGDAAEEIAESIEKGLGTLDNHWDGGAAQACVDFMTRVHQGVFQEGPLNGIVGEILEIIADQLKGVVQQILSKLNVPVKDVELNLVCTDDEAAWENAVAAAKAIVTANEELFVQSRELVALMKHLVETAVGVIEVMSDPAAATNAQADERFDKLGDQFAGLNVWLDAGSVALDAGELDVDDIADAPTDPINLSDDQDPERDGD